MNPEYNRRLERVESCECFGCGTPRGPGERGFEYEGLAYCIRCCAESTEETIREISDTRTEGVRMLARYGSPGAGRIQKKED